MMNIIEKLGGYDRAKSIANCKSGIVHPTQQLLDALLEYRREHNIFEVGDFVVLKSQPHLYAFVREYSYQKKNLLVKRANIINISIVKIRAEISKNISEIYHATDAEIEAGRRL